MALTTTSFIKIVENWLMVNTNLDVNKIVHLTEYLQRKVTEPLAEEEIKKAVEMARQLTERDETFDVESIMGLTEVQTSDMDLKYTPEEIIAALNTPQA